MKFGRQVGATFDQTWNQDRQYVEWAVQEASSQTGANWRLVQLAAWAVLTEKLPCPFDHDMLASKQKEPGLPPTCLAAILGTTSATRRGRWRTRDPPSGNRDQSRMASVLQDVKKEATQDNQALRDAMKAPEGSDRCVAHGATRSTGRTRRAHPEVSQRAIELKTCEGYHQDPAQNFEASPVTLTAGQLS